MHSILIRDDGAPLAYRLTTGRGPTVVFLPGFRSDMTGDKATHIAALCETHGWAMLRLDYSGHGASGGRFEEGCISRWRDDALLLIDRLTSAPLVLIGSSMGGWIALLVAVARADRIVGLIGIAAAPDFTERLMWQAMSPAERASLLRDGVLHVPGEYGEPYPITRLLIEDGRNNLLLDAPIILDCPVRLLHGQRDQDVPWETALVVTERITGADVRTILVKDGDHRLSRPNDLALLGETLAALLASQECCTAEEAG